MNMHNKNLVKSCNLVVTGKDGNFYFAGFLYRPNLMNEPVLVISYKGEDANILTKIAMESDIFVIENQQLAKLLCGQLEENNPIPPDFYKTLAELYHKAIRNKKFSMSLYAEEEFFNAVIKKEDIKILKQFINSGIDLNCRVVFGRTALHAAIESGSSLEIIKLLIESGSDVNIADNNGVTPLMLAIVFTNSVDLIQFLIRSGADINEKDAEGHDIKELTCALCKSKPILNEVLSWNLKRAHTKPLWKYAEKNENKTEIVN